MKFTVERKIENNVFSVSIAHKEYGTDVLSADEEKAILDSFNPTLAYKDITFSGNYDVVGGNVTAGGGNTVKLSLNNRVVNIDSTFAAVYRIDANSILDSQFAGLGNINTKELYAQAQCKLFEDKIIERLDTILKATRSMKNDFVKTEEVTK